jgi:NAD(P)-dependent dehydrogenase (short-subunit alcohol dehydrogenase family)
MTTAALAGAMQPYAFTLNPRVSPTHLAEMIRQAANRVLAVSPDLTALAEKLIPLCPTLEHVTPIFMGAALLLASDAGGHITGQTLVIDGGATII